MFDRLKHPVGPMKTNEPEDVRLVQRLLNRQASRTGVEIAETGSFDSATHRALEMFQRRVLHSHFASGTVSPGDETFRAMSSSTSQRLMAGGPGGLRLPRRTGDAALHEEDLQAAAAKLGCEVRIIRAVTAVESPRGAYDEFGRPSILFERHLFSRLTRGVHDRTAPDLSNPAQGGYGLYSAQYGRLQRAYALDGTAALRATSWGAFQILGDNYAQAGHDNVTLFIRSQCQSVQQQLDAFVAFVKFSPVLVSALTHKRWADFAFVYNGKNYKKNNYDVKLKEAYDQAKS